MHVPCILISTRSSSVSVCDVKASESPSFGVNIKLKKKKKVEKGRVRVTDILLNRHERNQENSSINKINKYSIKIKIYWDDIFFILL